MTNAEMPTSCKQLKGVQQQRLSDPAPFGVMQQSELCGNQRIELDGNDLVRSIRSSNKFAMGTMTPVPAIIKIRTLGRGIFVSGQQIS